MSLPQSTDIVIVGAGIAGLIAAREAVANGLSYTILEATERAGGRVYTEPIDLTQFPTFQSDLSSKLDCKNSTGTVNLENNGDQGFPSNSILKPDPTTYKFEHGGAWLHGIQDSKTLQLLNQLHYEQYPELGEDYLQREQIFEVFQGCAWLLPEFIPFNQILLFDTQTTTFFNQYQYFLYLVITVNHLRNILRQYPSLDLGVFAQEYVNWIETILPEYTFEVIDTEPGHNRTTTMSLSDLSNLYQDEGIPKETENTSKPKVGSTTIAQIIARSVGWYFSSIEGYHGVPIGDMESKDLFYPLTNKVYGDLAVFDDSGELDIASIILNHQQKELLFQLINKWMMKFMKTSDITQNQLKWADISFEMVKDYQSSKYNSLDTETHGCYIGPHCVLKCGMSILVKLLITDIEKKSQQPLNIRYNHTVTSITRVDNDNCNTNSDTLKYNTVTCTLDGLDGEVSTFHANKAIILTGSIPALTNTIQFPELSFSQEENDGESKLLPTPEQSQQFDQSKQLTLSHVLQTLSTTTLSVYYKKVAHCFSTPWWPRPETTRVIGVIQRYTDQSKIGTSDRPHSPKDFSQGNDQYTALFDSLDQYATASHPTIPFVNLLFECHYPAKNVPVLSASLVGNIAELLTTTEPLPSQKAPRRQQQRQRSDALTLSGLDAVWSTLNHLNQFPQQPLPSPVFSRTTQWGESSTFGHSYSLITDPTLGTASRVTLAAQNGIFFAGEGIDVYDTGSIHAAITTAEHAIRYINDGVDKMLEEEEDEWSIVGDDDE